MLISVVGLGYVGLPLAVEFAKKFQVIGFDINRKRIEELSANYDRTLEVDLKSTGQLNIQYTANSEDLKKASFHIITVPTPIDESNQPDLSPIISATNTVAAVLKKGDIVVYESTVYPGCTEEVCVPLLEKLSELKYNVDFYCGYSPERINPGDKEKTVDKIVKIVSGSTSDAAQKVQQTYASIITAGTYMASSIKVAEAAKVIENSQRDINIAFINELSLIFSKMGLDTREVLEAAATKWNFLKFYPGLVGGHCIGVDPYYLTHKAESLGYHPQVILAGRRINDSMGEHVASQVIKIMIKKKINLNEGRILVLGLTFKENCPDIRNSKVVDVIRELSEYGCQVDVYDPYALKEEVEHEYGITPLQADVRNRLSEYNAIILAVGHNVFKDYSWNAINTQKQVIYDVKGILKKELSDGRL